MTSAAAAAADVDVDALKSFIDDNEDLERLETLLDRFNMFEALGLVRQEIRHSAFIRWLLDPSETHGLNDYWLRQFLRQVIEAGEGISGDAPSLADLDSWDLGQAEVRKEWRNIDLLILDQEHRFVCVIENKVDSGEGSGQLQRYREIVEREFGDYRKAFVFLTTAGDTPSDDAYIPISYGNLVSIVETALQRRQSQVNDEIKLFVQQYLDMVRRHIVEESEIQELCRRLYQNHHRALDLIFEYRPDRQAEVFQVIRKCVGSLAESRGDLIMEKSTKSNIRFLPAEMKDIVPREGSGEWTDSKRMLLYELVISGEEVGLQLTLGPGSQWIREQVFKKAKELPQVFGKPKSEKLRKWTIFAHDTWITPKEYNELDDEDIRQRIKESMEVFLKEKCQPAADELRKLFG